MAFWAHLALQNHNVIPSDFMALSMADRAFMIASDLVSAEETEKRYRKAAKR